MFRWAGAGLLLAILANVAVANPTAGVAVAIFFLSLLGDLRRLLIPFTGWSPNDPLLLVAPAFALFLILLPGSRRLRVDTPLSRWIFALMMLMAVQTLNPLQGNLTVGYAGALFYIVPLFWYWIGRAHATTALMSTIFSRVVVPVAVAAALLGIYQTYVGFLPFEQAWLDTAGYVALNVGGVVRAFSFFPSASEYAGYLAVALVVIWSGCLQGRRAAVVVAPLLAAALFLESSRTIILLLLFTFCVMWAVQGKRRSIWMPRLAYSLCLALLGLAWGLVTIQEGDYFAHPAHAGLIEHQVAGLLNPLHPEKSTGMAHLEMAADGLSAMATHPLGYGLGATTPAALKYGGHLRSAEVDLVNVFLSLGIFGGLAYALIMLQTFALAAHYWSITRSPLALTLLGVLILQLGGWLQGGHYALSALDWLCIGALDRFDSEEVEEALLRR